MTKEEETQLYLQGKIHCLEMVLNEVLNHPAVEGFKTSIRMNVEERLRLWLDSVTNASGNIHSVTALDTIPEPDFQRGFIDTFEKLSENFFLTP